MHAPAPAATLEPLQTDTDLLRFSTAGSVDDGKSTLIGRLLYDAKQILTDQLEHVEAVSVARGNEYTDLALLTDGLRAERDQGITIDVAYRYFATPSRRFVIADTPGHPQYTRNMVTGASTCDLAVVLVDARKGLLEQSRRHAFLASLLGIPRLVVCVNKMDLVGYERSAFERVRDQFAAFASRLDPVEVSFIPISALHGDNVVERSAAMPWYAGEPLLAQLESTPVAADRHLGAARLPVQWVIRPQSAAHPDYRGYAGQIAGGVLRAGQEVMVAPSGLRTTIAGIDTFEGPVDEAFPPMSVTVRLADELDVSRGELICDPVHPPAVGQDLRATLCWMHTAELRPRVMYTLKHTTRTLRAMVTEVVDRLDVNTLERERGVGTLGLNDIARVRLRTAAPLAWDPYRRNRTTGSFILIDEATNNTVGAGMLAADD